jgi:hypothetical protein
MCRMALALESITAMSATSEILFITLLHLMEFLKYWILGRVTTTRAVLLITTTVVVTDGRLYYESLMRQDNYSYVTHLTLVSLESLHKICVTCIKSCRDVEKDL